MIRLGTSEEKEQYHMGPGSVRHAGLLMERLRPADSWQPDREPRRGPFKRGKFSVRRKASNVSILQLGPLEVCIPNGVYIHTCIYIIYTHLSNYLSISLSLYLSVHLSIYLSIFPAIYLSIHLSNYLSIDLSSSAVPGLYHRAQVWVLADVKAY